MRPDIRPQLREYLAWYEEVLGRLKSGAIRYTELLCGGFVLEGENANPILAALPPVIHVRSSGDSWRRVPVRRREKPSNQACRLSAKTRQRTHSVAIPEKNAKLEHASALEQIDAGGGVSTSRRSATKQKPCRTKKEGWGNQGFPHDR